MVTRHTFSNSFFNLFFIIIVSTFIIFYANIYFLIAGPNSNVEFIAIAQTVSHVQGKNYVLLNTTDTRNCPEFYDNSLQSNSTSESHINDTIPTPHNGSGLANNTEPAEEAKKITNICPFLKIMYPYECSSEIDSSSEIMCNSKEVLNQTDVEEEDNNKEEVEEEIPDNEIFDEKGLLIADTKFNKQYSYELVDPLDSDKKIRVNLDLAKQTQGHNNHMNSPRIEIQRENINGCLDMEAAKNQRTNLIMKHILR